MSSRPLHLVLATALGSALAMPAVAEPLPPGSLGVIAGATAGAGEDARSLGYGYVIGAQAAWQPMSTERGVGFSAKWSTVFGTMFDAEAARINSDLLTLRMDLLVGFRIRPAANPSRYLTAHIGGALYRANQVIPPDMQRAFVGPIASVGLDQYISGWLFNVDVRYGLIGPGPTELGLVIGVSKTGP